VAVDQLHVEGHAVRAAGDDAPVVVDRHAPEAGQIALQRVQAPARQVDIVDGARRFSL